MIGWFGRTLLVTAIVLGVTFTGSSTAAKLASDAGAQHVPDLSGVWMIREFILNILPKEDPPFQPWAKKLFDERRAARSQASQAGTEADDATARCIPPGVPRMMLQPFPFELIQAPNRVIMRFEYQALSREIYLDESSHPKDLDPTYMGNSIGKYERDALVIDTTGFNDKTWLDLLGMPHTDALHLTERIHRVDHDTLVDEFTIDDPKAYTAPWTAQKFFKLKPDWQIGEFVCAENNKYLK